MPELMQAWVVDRPGPAAGGPLVRVERAVPEPGPGEVRVRVRVCGVCRTDLHLAEGDLVPRRPRVTPGHEVVGVVDRLGPGASRWRAGDRIGVPWLAHTCGSCRFCVNGQSYICDIGASLFVREMPTDGTCRRHLGDENLLAYGQLGTFAEYAVLSERSRRCDSMCWASEISMCGYTLRSARGRQ